LHHRESGGKPYTEGAPDGAKDKHGDHRIRQRKGGGLCPILLCPFVYSQIFSITFSPVGVTEHFRITGASALPSFNIALATRVTAEG
jgi:hypothetical protein